MIKQTAPFRTRSDTVIFVQVLKTEKRAVKSGLTRCILFLYHIYGKDTDV